MVRDRFVDNVWNVLILSLEIKRWMVLSCVSGFVIIFVIVMILVLIVCVFVVMFSVVFEYGVKVMVIIVLLGWMRCFMLMLVMFVCRIVGIFILLKV